VLAKADRQKTTFLRKKTHENKLADFIPQGVRKTRTQALENVCLSSPLSSKNLRERLNTLGQKQYLAGEVGENCLTRFDE